jgi:hypothetical protein
VDHIGETVRDALVRVAAAERPETPVGLYSGEGRVVRVIGRVDRATSTFGNGTPKQYGEDLVVDGVRLGFVEGEDDQGTIIVEVGVVEQCAEPEIGPIGRKVNGGIVCIVDHVGRHKHPLRDSRVIEIDGKVVEVANLPPAGVIRGDRIVDNERVMLPYVEGICRCRGVEVVGGREAILFGMSMTDRKSMAQTHLKPSKPSVGIFSW